MTTSRIESLRTHLLNSALSISHENLSVHITDASVESHSSLANKHFQLDYQIIIGIDQYSGDLPSLTLILLGWLETHYPNHAEKPFMINAEILDSEASLIEVIMPITDIYKVTAQENGYDYELIVPPRLDTVCPDATLQTTFVRSSQ